MIWVHANRINHKQHILPCAFTNHENLVFFCRITKQVCEFTGHFYNFIFITTTQNGRDHNQEQICIIHHWHPFPFSELAFPPGEFYLNLDTPWYPISDVSQPHVSACSASLAAPGCCICGSLKGCINCHHLSQESVPFLNEPFLKRYPSLVGAYIKYLREKEFFKGSLDG